MFVLFPSSLSEISLIILSIVLLSILITLLGYLYEMYNKVRLKQILVFYRGTKILKHYCSQENGYTQVLLMNQQPIKIFQELNKKIKSNNNKSQKPNTGYNNIKTEMNYLKSVVKNVYEKVIEDQYLQLLSEHDVYLIINNTSRRRLASHGKDPRKLSVEELEVQLFRKVEEIGNIAPERLFRMFGADPNIEVVAAKTRELGENLEEISGLMQDNFYKYQRRMNESIAQIDNLKNLYNARKYSMQLRSKLKSLQQASIKSKKIAHLNIKAKNLKHLIKVLTQIPNIKKMTLTQLKSINIEQIKNKTNFKSLHCIRGITKFIDDAVAKQLTSVLQKLKECLVVKFNQVEYQNALKDFIIAQHETIKYETLFIKIIENKIQHSDMEYKSNIYQICESYIKLISNLHEVYRWHRLNQKQEKWQHLSKGYYGISIQIDISRINRRIVEVMDQCLKDIILPKFYQYEHISDYLSNLYIICRILQILYAFSGVYLNTIVKEITEFIVKKLSKIRQKAMHQLEQTVKYEQKNYWNRLPVTDTYSHEPIDRTIYQIYKHARNPNYAQVLSTLSKCSLIFKDIWIQVDQVCLLSSKQKYKTNLWTGIWNIQLDVLVVREINGAKISDSLPTTPVKKIQFFNNPQPSPSKQNQNGSLKHENGEHREQQQQNWQIQDIHFAKIQKYQKHKEQISLKPKQPNYKTIICQYSITILKYIEIYFKYCFYFPVQPVLSSCIGNMSLMLDHYIYQIFNGFISNNLKIIFFEKYDNLVTLEQRYHKKRLHYQYPNISKFILAFKNSNKLTLRQFTELDTMGSNPNISNTASSGLRHSNSMGASGELNNLAKENFVVRSRVVALQSLYYLIMYYEHVWKLAAYIPSTGREEKQTNNQYHHIFQLYPELATKISFKLNQFYTIYSQLTELIYTDCIPKMCNLKNTYSLIQSIKWNQDENIINQYIQVFSKNCTQFYYKLISNNRGEVPLHICDRLYGIFWKTQLTAIMKSFMVCYRPGKNLGNFNNNPKNKLEKFIDGLYENVSSVVKEKVYMRVPYEKIKAIFPILMENSWENTFEMLKLTLYKYEFVFAVSMGLFLASQSCCYLANQDMEERKKKVEAWIQQNLIENARDFDGTPIKK